jgi:hypothetical protein
MGSKRISLPVEGLTFYAPCSLKHTISPEQIIGSTVKTEYPYNSGKPENIQRTIRCKPVIAAGHAGRNLAMLQATASKNS